jgi:hypothetical protein
MLHAWIYKALLLFIITFAACVLQAEAQRRVQTEPQGTATRDSSVARQGRLRAREDLGCDVNDTTSFTGRVLSYSRNSKRIFIRVRTDEETTEQFTLALTNGSDPARLFLFNGEGFKPEDWRKIETRAGVLKKGMRATVWACYVRGEPKAKLIDWRPRERDTGSVY